MISELKSEGLDFPSMSFYFEGELLFPGGRSSKPRPNAFKPR
jgi:hypothetical protein